ncbi:DMT family transporter [Schaalia vaccimaxillae]|uniref:DMT family transporter n=1 Tax=Schaalia vaccimaxillae TaxID=183916 RepID=UPI0003B75C40|nr:DMT family transporter [Schaalia vaccimaxillae]
MMTRSHTASLLPALGLTTVTAVWGSTFFLTKNLLEDLQPLDFLAVRFTIAALAGCILFGQRISKVKRRTWARGLTAGLIYFAAQFLQTIGLTTTDASISGFITGMYVVLTPVVGFLLFSNRQPARTWIAVIIATSGLMVLSLNGLSYGTGETLTLGGALLYAFHIVVLGQWAERDDPLALATIQLISIAVLASIAAVPGGYSIPTTPANWMSLLYMALIAALAALVIQTWAQSRIPAASAAIIMTTEPAFASFFAIAFGGERLTARLIIGGILMIAAMLITELRPPKGSHSINKNRYSTDNNRR